MFCLDAEDPDKELDKMAAFSTPCPHWKFSLSGDIVHSLKMCQENRAPVLPLSLGYSVYPKSSLEILSLLTQAKGKFIPFFLMEYPCGSWGIPALASHISDCLGCWPVSCVSMGFPGVRPFCEVCPCWVLKARSRPQTASRVASERLSTWAFVLRVLPKP